MARQPRADAGGRPWCIQFELVEGCSMRHGSGPGGLCHFCGLAAIRNGPGDYKYTSLELAQKLADNMAEFCPGARVEYALRGEPLMHPKHADIFRIMRDRLPKSRHMVTTNGDTLRGKMQERVQRIFDAGVDIILMDTYYPKERRDALRAEAYALQGISVTDFYTDWVEKGLSPYHNHHRKFERAIVLLDDISVRDGEHTSRVVKTHAGSNMTKATPLMALSRTCGRPFREMAIAWNGDVTLCCDDWLHAYIVGNVGRERLETIWTSPPFEAARARLAHKDRDFGPCRQCDAPAAPRSGLLPVYEPATPEQIRLTETMEHASQNLIPLWKLRTSHDSR
jgi:radical SAM protein with 4Fe4S-binding SPASM domain